MEILLLKPKPNPTAIRRNLLSFTEVFSNAVWGKILGATVTPNTTIAPDGTLTGDTITFSANSSNRIEQLAGNAVVGQTVTASIWLRGSGTIGLNVGSDAPGNVDGVTESTITLTSQWVRHSVTVTYVGSAGLRRMMIIWRTFLTATTVDVWGAQMEIGATPSNYQMIG